MAGCLSTEIQSFIAVGISNDEAKSHVVVWPERKHAFGKRNAFVCIAFGQISQYQPMRQAVKWPVGQMRVRDQQFLGLVLVGTLGNHLEDFRDACYRHVPSSADVYTKEVSLAGITESVITDAFDGTDTYDWTGMIAPDGLVACMSARSRSLLNAWEGFDGGHAEKNQKMFPQPWFVTEIMKGYIAELEFEQYIEAQFGVSAHHLQLGVTQLKYIEIVKHPLYAELYQMYDYYLELGNDTIAAIDIKNWARSTDRLKREELQAQAIEKHARIRALLPDQVVHAFYVNLYGAHKHAIVNAPSSGSIQFMSLYVSSTNPFGISSWIPNENLANALSR